MTTQHMPKAERIGKLIAILSAIKYLPTLQPQTTTISKRIRLNMYDNLLQVSRNVTNAPKSSILNDCHFLIVVAIVVISGFVEAIKNRKRLII